MLTEYKYLRLRQLLAFLWSASVSKYNPSQVLDEAIILR